MNRLTKRASNGMPYLVNVKQNEQELEGSYNTLKCVQEAFEKLAKYEDYAESGQLVKVVRCKDCLHKGEPICPMDDVVIEDELDDNCYCSFGI